MAEEGRQEMRGGERFLRCLRKERIDRAPFGIGYGWMAWAATMERWREETGNPELNPAEELDYDLGPAPAPIDLGLSPRFEYEVLDEDQSSLTVRSHQGIVMRQRRDRGSMPQFLEYPVEEPRDWDQLKDERLRLDDPDRTPDDWSNFLVLAEERGAVQVGDFPYGLFGTPRDLLGAEGLLMAFHTYPDMVHDMMEHLTELWINTWEKVAEQVQIDRLHLWEDMAGRQGSLISPEMIEEFMRPGYERIAEFAKRNQIEIFSVDSDGECHELVALMTGYGVNCFEPFEVQAGNDILAYREKYPQLGIMGGLDKRALAADRAAIDVELRRAEEMLGEGRYVVGFDHLIPPDVPWENFRYAAERLRELCYAAR